MAHAQLRTVLRHLRCLAGGPDEPTDRRLLERFAASRDEDAFAALVRRHGALVWGVCWRALGHAQDAEDCFQSTFLVLARKAAAVGWRDSVANWLYEVASRVAGEARTRRARRRTWEGRADARPGEDPMREAAARELCAALDDELHALPERYRAPLLACYLEGQTGDRAARQLGLSVRTLQRRLARGKQLLRGRLTRRGLTLSGVLLEAALSGDAARAALPPRLAAATAAAAHALVVGGPATGLKLATAAAVLLAAAAGGAALIATAAPAGAVPQGGLVAGGQPPRREPAPPPAKPADATADAPAGEVAGRVWAVLDVVEQNHPNPPPRAELILAGLQGLLRAADAPAPDDLARRAAVVTSAEQLRALLRDVWPKTNQVPGATTGRLHAAFVDAVLGGVPGRPQLFGATEVKRMDSIGGNRYVGIGVQLGMSAAGKQPQITIPIRRGPARRGGARPGDLLLRIDGTSTEGLDLQRVVTLLQGEEGTPVTIVVRQPGAADERTLKLTRSVIPFESVFGFRRTSEEGWDYVTDHDARIGYVWVNSLSSSTPHELERVERRLRADGVRALVLDFRQNNAGDLHHAALFADALLDGGVMWKTVGKDERVYRADRECLFRSWPLAALVDGTESNAVGAVLAALQDNRRAVLIGQPTKTDGTVRRLYDLPDHTAAIALLSGRLERADPSRGWPVRPDRPADMTGPARAAVAKWLRDKELPELADEATDRPPADPQLAAALAVLRNALKSEGRPTGGGK
ncbi:MAG TPA: sigma-70 family RNA polymerase sigma factor [Gemmataceae bacterium]|jgi:C-terminal peptidase prc